MDLQLQEKNQLKSEEFIFSLMGWPAESFLLCSKTITPKWWLWWWLYSSCESHIINSGSFLEGLWCVYCYMLSMMGDTNIYVIYPSERCHSLTSLANTLSLTHTHAHAHTHTHTISYELEWFFDWYNMITCQLNDVGISMSAYGILASYVTLLSLTFFIWEKGMITVSHEIVVRNKCSYIAAHTGHIM